MTLSEKEEIRVIKRLQTSLPVDVVGIAIYFGLGVWEDHNLPDGISGKIFRDLKNGGVAGYSIAVRAQDSPVRKRFTVAHELAHYILHRNLFRDVLMDDALYRSGLNSRVEAQANRLAAEILMPLHLIAPIQSLPSLELATKAQVSEEAMNIRLLRNQGVMQF